MLAATNLSAAENSPFAISPASKNPACLPAWIAPPLSLPPPNTPFSAEADRIQQPDELHYELMGRVQLKRPGLVVLSDRVLLNRTTEEARGFGYVELQHDGLIVTSESARLNQQQQTAQLKGARYQFIDTRAHGRAQQVDVDQIANIAELDHASYTTCPLVSSFWQDTDQYDWELEFGHLQIDNNKRRVYGYNTWLHFQNVPVFYTPYIDFPMDDRASGFLFPTFGSYRPLTSNTAETYVAVPYYFNLAPNYDDTLTVMKMQDRGWVLDNEFRYQLPGQSAELSLTGLNDQVTARDGLAHLDENGDLTYGDKVEQRWRAKLNARQQWAPGLNSDILWHELSDKYFYTDIPVESALDSASYTERYLNLNYNHENFQAGVHVLNYLRLRDDAPYNYGTRPRISLNYFHPFEQDGLRNFSVNLPVETTEFQIDKAAKMPEAQRNALSPSLQYQYLKPYGQLKAEAVANKVHYYMEDNGYNTSGQDQLDITVPQFALRGKLIFERDFSLAGQNLIQTLEPEAQYLYVPYQNQSAIPLFDTDHRSLDFSNLFSYNRYTGMDRIGDTNQVAAALTTRFLKRDGTPIAEAGLGQIFYLEDRKVTLNNTDAEQRQNTQAVSDYYLNLGLTAGPLYFASTSQYDVDNYALTNSNSRVKLSLSSDFNVLAAHQLTDQNQPSEQENVAAGMTWQITPEWGLGGYINYDFTQERKTEMQSALRYDNCCWATELSVKETQLDNGLYNYSFLYLIEFKGLSSVGTPFKEYLSDKLNF
ncbi:MAG: LPS-assembly protein LptD [Hydrogenovibrio sp.]